jgi:hypothetical protein
MTILEVPDTAGAKTVEVLAFVDRMLKSPGPLTQDQKTIVTQVHTLLTSFVNSPDITPDIAELRTQNTELSVKNAELATRNLTLQTENEGLTLDLQNARSATTAVNSLLDDARKTITSLEKRPEPMQTETPPACTHDHTLTEELNQEINIQEEVIAQLREDLAAERAVSRALARNTNATPVTTAAASTPAPQKIPDPEKYGGDRNKLRSFLVQLRLKAATFPTVPEKLRFAVNCLKDDALDQVSPYVKDDTVDLPDLAALIQILENAFGNPNRVQDAERKLNTIQQGNRDFSSYYAEFSRYAAEVSWDEAAKLASLRHGISGTLKRDLIPTLENSQTVTDFVKICQQLDNRRRTVNQESGSRFGSFTRTGGPASNTSRTTPATGTSSSPAPNNTTTAVGTAPGPMDLSANRRRITPEERARRMAEGRCLYCGGLGHMARDCPTKPQVPRPLRANETTTSPAPPPVTVERITEVESGKE